MALNTITPSNREEEYLSAIAGDEGASAPVPSNRREEWLRRIAEGQGDQTDRLDHIEDQIPVDPTVDDIGKVMTVIADTSGEEPVYKWSAEDSASDPVTVYRKVGNVAITPPTSTGWKTFSSVTADSIPHWSDITAKLRELRGSLAFYDYLNKHIIIHNEQGAAILPLPSAAPDESATTISLEILKYPLIGSAGNGYIQYYVLITFAENINPGSVVIDPKYKIYEANGTTQISSTSDYNTKIGTTPHIGLSIEVKY